MEESGADYDIAMEGSNDLFIGSCDGTEESETNDQVFQVRYEHFVFVDASFTSSLSLKYAISSMQRFFLAFRVIHYVFQECTSFAWIPVPFSFELMNIQMLHVMTTFSNYVLLQC